MRTEHVLPFSWLFIWSFKFRCIVYSRTSSSKLSDCIAVSVFRRVCWIVKSDYQLCHVHPSVRMVTARLTLDRLFIICGFVKNLSRKYVETRQEQGALEDELLWWYLADFFLFFYPGATAPQWAKASSLSRIHDHTQAHYTP